MNFKKCSLTMEAEASLNYYPTYLASSFFPLYSKKILIGISSAFEVKVLILIDKKSLFLECSKEVFFKFLLLLDEILSNIESNISTKYQHNLGENICIRGGGSKTSKVSLNDEHRNITVNFTREEIHKILEWRTSMYYVLNKLVLNLSSVRNFYKDYLRVASEKNLITLTQHELFLPSHTENFFSIDFQKIFFEIPIIFGEAKIKRDIENTCLSTALDNIVNYN